MPENLRTGGAIVIFVILITTPNNTPHPMTRKQISESIVLKSTFGRKGYSYMALFRGQEVGSSMSYKKADVAKEEARKVGTEAVYAALGLAAIERDILALLNGPWLKEEAGAGREYLATHEGNATKLNKLLARCQELVAERTANQSTELRPKDAHVINAGSSEAAGEYQGVVMAIAA